jgi:hypothetical protein
MGHHHRVSLVELYAMMGSVTRIRCRLRHLPQLRRLLRNSGKLFRSHRSSLAESDHTIAFVSSFPFRFAIQSTITWSSPSNPFHPTCSRDLQYQSTAAGHRRFADWVDRRSKTSPPRASPRRTARPPTSLVTGRRTGELRPWKPEAAGCRLPPSSSIPADPGPPQRRWAIHLDPLDLLFWFLALPQP